MGKKIPKFSKLALSALIAVFALTFLFSSGSGGFLKASIGEAAGPAIGLTIDNPGIRTAAEVQDRQSERLMGIPGVVGHGIGISSDGEPVITIFVERTGIPGIPAALEGVPTKVKLTGMFVAYDDPTARFPRPVPIGVSTGHPDITAGTIGCKVTDGTNFYALSNNHIYANENAASYGDNVLQPGPYDGGQNPADAIGTLFEFVPIDFSGGENYVDAAIALSSDSNLGCSTPADGYGIPNSTTESASVGQNVQKYGRTTGWTHGQVAELNVTVEVCYETRGPFRCVKSARFVDQISITPGSFSDGGDSGSLIVTDDGFKNPVGLLFAGSTTRTLANRIDTVLDKFTVLTGSTITVVNECSVNTCTDADRDGYCIDVDCDDIDGSINPGATEVCDDGADNDCDGAVDCDDTDCDSDPACDICIPEPEVCDDGADNDCDGAVDCDDTDCDSDPACFCLDIGEKCRSDSDCCTGDCRGKCR
jgi:hypothetical protein